ncbi:MAG: DUF4124 domain-containing protein [Candidatus Sedimenticola sp. PURPLELP]
MLNGMKKAVLFLLLIFPFSVFSAVYKWIGPDGSVHYSDVPEKGSKQIDLPEPTIYQQRLPGSGRGSDPSDEVSFAGYTKLAISSPKNEQVIFSNEGKVDVTMVLAPSLQKGHKFRVYLDGSEVSSGLTTTQVMLQNVERGGHTLSAVVVNKESRELIRSNYVRFYLRQKSESGSGETPESGSSGDPDVDASQYAPPSSVDEGTDRDEYKGSDPLPAGQERTQFEGDAPLPAGQERSDFSGDAPLPSGTERGEYQGSSTTPNSVNPGYSPAPKNTTSPAFAPANPGYKAN